MDDPAENARMAFEELHLPQDARIVLEDFEKYTLKYFIKYIGVTGKPKRIVYLGFYLCGDLTFLI